MTRAEIGNYLGMTLETVSRALSRLARGDVIRFTEKGRRDIHIPQVEALTAFIQRCLRAGAGAPAVGAARSPPQAPPSIARRSRRASSARV